MDSILTGRINVPLSASEAQALRHLAELEHRQPREQARFIIFKELKKRGLLKTDALLEESDQSIKVGAADGR